MATYDKPDAQTLELLKKVVEKYHGGLAKEGVTIATLAAHARRNKDDEPVGCALKHHGIQCMATVRIVGYKDRCKGNKDVELLYDADRWGDLSEREKLAILDHELTHLEVRYDKDGNCIRDDRNRPKLQMRLHDHEFGWFDSVARRWGKDSVECQQAGEFFGSSRQTYFPGMEDVAGAEAFNRQRRAASKG